MTDMVIKIDGKYQYRCGEKVRRILTTNRAYTNGLTVISEAVNGNLHFHHLNGYCSGDGHKNNYDLVELPEKFVMWIYLYSNGSYKIIREENFEYHDETDPALLEGMVQKRKIVWEPDNTENCNQK